MSKKQQTFGQVLREARLAKGITLRKFAEMVGISPTYLSQVEQDNVDPPTAERVHTMATLLGANADEWTALAGRVPEDLPGIIQKQPTAIPELLREASGLTAEQLRILREQARKLKERGTAGGGEG
ncbi:MAG: helix-turn-helix transcriptional regulator [Gemmataceae bacterium]